uniref:Uncharacterized protein n=1 Tax=Setaria italica TaxID=4555 RepID=K4AP26_SETIT
MSQEDQQREDYSKFRTENQESTTVYLPEKKQMVRTTKSWKHTDTNRKKEGLAGFMVAEVPISRPAFCRGRAIVDAVDESAPPEPRFAARRTGRRCRRISAPVAGSAKPERQVPP